MALNLDGIGGELRRGTKRVADLATWQKRDKRITYTTGYVNPCEAGRGQPTEIVLHVTPKVRRIYPIVGYDASGRVDVDLMTARTETTL